MSRGYVTARKPRKSSSETVRTHVPEPLGHNENGAFKRTLEAIIAHVRAKEPSSLRRRWWAKLRSGRSVRSSRSISCLLVKVSSSLGGNEKKEPAGAWGAARILRGTFSSRPVRVTLTLTLRGRKQKLAKRSRLRQLNRRPDRRTPSQWVTLTMERENHRADLRWEGPAWLVQFTDSLASLRLLSTSSRERRTRVILPRDIGALHCRGHLCGVAARTLANYRQFFHNIH